MASASSRTPKCGNVPVHANPKYKKSSGHRCVVFGCQNNQRKRSRLLSAVCEEHNTRRESCRCGVFSLHRFPSATKNDKLRHRWIAAVNRKNYQPSENARVVKGRRLLIRQSNDLASWLPNAANPVVTMTNKTKLKVQRTMFCVL
nr:uncharacterized protein LOC129382239 [Dermacentor andersoni]